MTEQQAAYTLAGAIAHANDSLDWIEARKGPLPEDGYARIETSVGVVRALGRETTVGAADCGWCREPLGGRRVVRIGDTLRCEPCIRVEIARNERDEARAENARLRERVGVLEGWAEAMDAWVVNVVDIVDARRIPSADVLADGEEIRNGLRAALAGQPAAGGA